MTTKEFWELIEESKKQGTLQIEWLVDTLSNKDSNEIIDFEVELSDKFNQSYTSALWGAAYVIMGGCSDDSFEYFRGWLISRGEEVFRQAVQNPEYLASYLTDEMIEDEDFMPELEEMLSVASDAYAYKKTGSFDFDDVAYDEFEEELEARGGVQSPTEFGFDWEEDEEDLARKYPLLWAKFGENPLG